MKKNDFRTQFDPPKVQGFHFNKPSLTQQSFAYETNINNIVKGCVSSLPPSTNPPKFGTTFKPGAYNEALNIIANAKSQFECLPSHIRAKFENNPAKLLAFIDDEKNRKEAEELGLLEKDITLFKPEKVKASEKPSDDVSALSEGAVS